MNLLQKTLQLMLSAFTLNREIRKTHDIAELITLCSEVDPEFSKLSRIDIVSLTDYAVEIRYPDEFYFPSIFHILSSFLIFIMSKQLATTCFNAFTKYKRPDDKTLFPSSTILYF